MKMITFRRLISLLCAAALVIGLCGLVLPAKVKALSSDEIQEQIEELEAQNEQLQSQIDELDLPEAKFFADNYLSSFTKPLDDITLGGADE